MEWNGMKYNNNNNKYSVFRKAKLKVQIVNDNHR
jgi:hypothetical protein